MPTRLSRDGGSKLGMIRMILIDWRCLDHIGIFWIPKYSQGVVLRKSIFSKIPGASAWCRRGSSAAAGLVPSVLRLSHNVFSIVALPVSSQVVSKFAWQTQNKTQQPLPWLWLWSPLVKDTWMTRSLNGWRDPKTQATNGGPCQVVSTSTQQELDLGQEWSDSAKHGKQNSKNSLFNFWYSLIFHFFHAQISCNLHRLSFSFLWVTFLHNWRHWDVASGFQRV